MISDEFDKNYKTNVSHATMDYLFQSIRAGDEEIERLTKQNKALNEMYELTKKEYIRLNNIINEINSIIEYWGYDKEHNDISGFRMAMKNIKDILDRK